jgi:hypothetical protein
MHDAVIVCVYRDMMGREAERIEGLLGEALIQDESGDGGGSLWIYRWKMKLLL